MMTNFQKLTALAFAYYDSQKPIESLNPDQKSQLIRYLIKKLKKLNIKFYFDLSKPPSFVEFFSYMFYFQGAVLGPLCFYNDYIEFVNGNNYLKHQVL